MNVVCTPSVPGLDHTPGTKLFFGAGCVERIGEFVARMDVGRVLLVSDPGVADAGHVARLESLLAGADLTVFAFTDTHENPTTADVDRCLKAAREAKPDVIIGLGGGSSMDTAKGCNFLLTNGGRMADYWGIGKANNPLLPFIAVPTTHGTGSETQSFALIADERTHQKMACGDAKALPVAAFLDPVLTLTQPQRVAACTGIDAITHAVEAFVCTRRNEVSTAYARESLCLTINHLPKVIRDGEDIEARGSMLLGAAYAGLAIENSMLGAAHAAANPLTAHFNVIHGHAVGLMLPHVMRYNACDDEVRAMYDQLACDSGLDGFDALHEVLRGIVTESGLAGNLGDIGVNADAIPVLAEEAASQWTAGFNPRPIDADGFTQLYHAALGTGEV